MYHNQLKPNIMIHNLSTQKGRNAYASANQKVTIDIEAAKRTLTVAEALELLRTYDENRKKRVHTFEKSFFGVMGCAMDLSVIKKRIKLALINEIFISDTVAGHGVVFLDHTRNQWLFLETDKDKLNEIKKIRKIN